MRRHPDIRRSKSLWRDWAIALKYSQPGMKMLRSPYKAVIVLSIAHHRLIAGGPLW